MTKTTLLQLNISQYLLSNLSGRVEEIKVVPVGVLEVVRNNNSYCCQGSNNAVNEKCLFLQSLAEVKSTTGNSQLLIA